MNQELTRQALEQILQAENIEHLSLADLTRLFRSEQEIANFAPDGICQIDPRNGERIIYNSARARRPHDNQPTTAPANQSTPRCLICEGQTTGVVDVAGLSEGFTFINKNLFPILYPPEMDAPTSPPSNVAPGPAGTPAYGFHFLQWTSSQHDKDWPNMPLADRVIVLQRLAALEKTLLDQQPDGFVTIVKNYGRLVGGSLAHGHQQIGFSNVMPRRFYDNWQFEMSRGEPFSAYLLRENSAELVIRDYGTAVLLVPYFMRRPFDMMLLLKDAGKRYLHEMSEAEIAAVADGWHDALRAILAVMPAIGREIAYNVTTCNGPGAGLYFEFLPYTQETGGFEHLGLAACQGNPQNAAAQLREILND